jgi:TPP-dependent pyruvate/acetoin dehydrogenase alpha subunit
VLDDYPLDGFDVAVVLIEAAGDFYGADYGAAAGLAVARMFDEAIEGAAEFVATEIPEAAGVGMAIEGREIGDAEFS